MKYEDFELLATDVQIIERDRKKMLTFQLRVVRSPAGENIDGVPSEYNFYGMDRRLKVLKTLDWQSVIQLGEWLGKVLFPEPVRQLLLRSIDLVKARKKGLRIRLLLEGLLNNVPWEFVLINRGGGEAAVTDFLALMPDVSIARHQAAALPPWEIKAEHTARLVVALASPKGYEALNTNEEQRVIEQAIKGNIRIKANFVTDAAPETLLKDVGKVHLFHFAGHGIFESKLSPESGKGEGKGFIILDNGSNEAALMSAGQLALRLRQAGVRAAVLGACHSGRRDHVNVWSSVAAALLKAELGAVVGMQYPIQDDSAIAFAEAFYRALVSGLSMDEAVTSGRMAIPLTDSRGWGVPVLYLRASDGVIFPEYAADLTLEQARKQIRVKIKQQAQVIKGKMTGVEVTRMTRGEVNVKQTIGTVTESGEVTGFKAEQMGDGSVESDQTVDKVEGSVTGVRLDTL